MHFALTTDQWIQLAIALPTAGTCIAVAIRFIVRVVRQINLIAHNVAIIYHEVTPNHGSSLKDKVLKSEVAIADLQKTQKDQTARLTRIESLLDGKGPSQLK